MHKNNLLKLGSISLIATSLFLSGCQTETPKPPTNSNNQTETENNSAEQKTNFELAGTSWTWIKNTMKDGSVIKSSDLSEFVLTFGEDNKVSSSTDCNSLGGEYELKDNKLIFSPFVQTLMLCTDSQETDYVSALSLGGTVNVDVDMLTISSAEVSMEFAKTANPEPITPPESDSSEATTPDLAGTSWQWVNTSMSDGSVIEPSKPESFVLSFDQDGKVSSKTDCNSLSSTYTSLEGNLTFGPLAMTKMFCEGSQESVYAKNLGEVQSYLVNDQILSLALKLDSGIMEFTKVN